MQTTEQGHRCSIPSNSSNKKRWGVLRFPWCNTPGLVMSKSSLSSLLPLQKAIDYQTNPHYAYLWLAASLWQTTHQWEMVFPLLQQAAARYDRDGNPWERFRTLREFEDVQHWNGCLL